MISLLYPSRLLRLALLPILLASTACSNAPAVPLVTTVPTLAPPPRLAPPAPAPISLRPLTWTVDGAKDYCLSEQGFYDLEANQLSQATWIGSAKATLDFYKSDAENAPK